MPQKPGKAHRKKITGLEPKKVQFAIIELLPDFFFFLGQNIDPFYKNISI